MRGARTTPSGMPRAAWNMPVDAFGSSTVWPLSVPARRAAVSRAVPSARIRPSTVVWSARADSSMARAVAATTSRDGGPNRAKSRYPAGVSKWAAYDVSTGLVLPGGCGTGGTGAPGGECRVARRVRSSVRRTGRCPAVHRRERIRPHLPERYVFRPVRGRPGCRSPSATRATASAPGLAAGFERTGVPSSAAALIRSACGATEGPRCAAGRDVTGGHLLRGARPSCSRMPVRPGISARRIPRGGRDAAGGTRAGRSGRACRRRSRAPSS